MTQEERSRSALRRYAMIDALADRQLQPGEKATLLADAKRRYGVSVSTLKRYLKRYQTKRGAGLERQRRCDRGQPRRVPAEALELAGRLRAEVPTRTTATLIEMLEDEHPEWKGLLKRSTLDRHLNRQGKSRRVLGQDRKPRRRFAKTARGALMQMDICIPSLWVAAEHGEVKQAILVLALDDATRYICWLEAFLTQDGGVVETTFKKAALRCGLPTAVFVDNGSQFISEQFTSACEALGVRHMAARPYSPESKGKVERALGSLQRQLIPELHALGRTLDLAELNQYLLAWVDEYHRREHRELKATPQTRWDQDPTPLRMPDALRLEAAFLLRAERYVNRTALVSVCGRRYLVHDSLVGRKVEVRYHPRRTQSVQIWLDDRFVQAAELYQTPTNAPKQQATEAAPITTGLNRAQQMHDRRQAELKRRAQTAGFAARAAQPTPVAWTEGRLVVLLEQALGRPLEAVERELVRKAWPLCSAVGEAAADRDLRRLVNRQGADHHISVYLEQVAHRHLREVTASV